MIFESYEEEIHIVGEIKHTLHGFSIFKKLKILEFNVTITLNSKIKESIKK